MYHQITWPLLIGILKNRGSLYSEMQSVEKKNTRKITENYD